MAVTFSDMYAQKRQEQNFGRDIAYNRTIQKIQQQGQDQQRYPSELAQLAELAPTIQSLMVEQWNANQAKNASDYHLSKRLEINSTLATEKDINEIKDITEKDKQRWAKSTAVAAKIGQENYATYEDLQQLILANPHEKQLLLRKHFIEVSNRTEAHLLHAIQHDDRVIIHKTLGRIRINDGTVSTHKRNAVLRFLSNEFIGVNGGHAYKPEYLMELGLYNKYDRNGDVINQGSIDKIEAKLQTSFATKRDAQLQFEAEEKLKEGMVQDLRNNIPIDFATVFNTLSFGKATPSGKRKRTYGEIHDYLDDFGKQLASAFPEVALKWKEQRATAKWKGLDGKERGFGTVRLENESEIINDEITNEIEDNERAKNVQLAAQEVGLGSRVNEVLNDQTLSTEERTKELDNVFTEYNLKYQKLTGESNEAPWVLDQRQNLVSNAANDIKELKELARNNGGFLYDEDKIGRNPDALEATKDLFKTGSRFDEIIKHPDYKKVMNVMTGDVRRILEITNDGNIEQDREAMNFLSPYEKLLQRKILDYLPGNNYNYAAAIGLAEKDMDELVKKGKFVTKDDIKNHPITTNALKYTPGSTTKAGQAIHTLTKPGGALHNIDFTKPITQEIDASFLKDLPDRYRHAIQSTASGGLAVEDSIVNQLYTTYKLNARGLNRVMATKRQFAQRLSELADWKTDKTETKAEKHANEVLRKTGEEYPSLIAWVNRFFAHPTEGNLLSLVKMIDLHKNAAGVA